ncbi:MAG: threonylcarbamoyl-AMP synthase [Bacteroidia bacterium]|nr:threonylcarbamoyl-AMP synthase [Crocinitomicaceae bacterium]MBP6754903.1 threonylcarbamoyl-AMP synthase [Bacteroidia bacterium]
MLIEINPENINSNYIDRVVEVLKKGGIIIFPTDSVYAMGCDLYNKKALEKLAKLKGIKLNKANFSIICNDFSNLSKYVKPIEKSIFKLLNTYLPGPFTFILPATNEIPKLFDSNRKEIGIRIPDNQIIISIVEQLGNPIATTSLKDEESFLEYHNDPAEIYERYAELVELIIDGGYGKLEGTTIVDCSTGAPEIIRQGLGILE